MKVKVHMLAFMEGQIREIAIPDFKPTRGVELLLEDVFHYGQNDFQNVEEMRSVSSGDVA